LPALKELGSLEPKLQVRFKHGVSDPAGLSSVTQHLREKNALILFGYKADELDALAVKATELRAPGACDWLQALPIVANMELPTDMLRVVLAHHLLLPRKLFFKVVGLPLELQRGCLCGIDKDTPLTEQHLAGCGYGGEVISRHNEAVKVLEQVAKWAGCSKIVKEPTGLRNYNNQRPDLKFFDSSLRGRKKTVIMDVSVTAAMPTSGRAIAKALVDPLYKGQVARARKIKENDHRMESTQRFKPMIFQSTGGMCKEVVNFIRHPGLRMQELPCDIAERSTAPMHTIAGWLRHRLVMKIVKGTALNMMGLAERLCVKHGKTWMPGFD